MAAPTATARVAPSGAKLRNGHKTFVTLAIDPNIEFWEKEVTPPGIEGGEPVAQGDMFDVAWTTKIPAALKEMTMMTLIANYGGQTYPDIVAATNVPTTITPTFPNDAKLAFYGYLKSFKPGSAKRNEQPNATVEIVPTNLDPTDFSEAGPVYVAPP